MPKKQVNISVVIPAYNEEGRLPQTLKAILKQDVLPKEVIVVDNASTDSTFKTAKSFQSKFNKNGVNLKVVAEPKKGVARARNKGFRAASYSIIASTDADSQPHPNWIENIWDHFDHHNSIAVTGSIILADAPTPIRIMTELRWYQFLNLMGKTFLGFRAIHTANAALKKEFFERCGGFNEAIVSPEENDDFEISSRLVQFGEIRFDPTLKVDTSYRRYTSNSQAIRTIFKRIRAWLKVSRVFRENNHS